MIKYIFIFTSVVFLFSGCSIKFCNCMTDETETKTVKTTGSGSASYFELDLKPQ